MALSVVILAAGKGSRMRSRRPKVLHPIAGKPLLGHVLDTARALEPTDLHVVVGHGAEQVRAAFAGDNLDWVEQTQQLGTGHALAQAMPQVPADATVLVLYGDVPLLQRETLNSLLAQAGRGRLALLTVTLDDPTGYGRILRDDAGAVTGIVEQKDARADQLAIQEVNTGVLAAQAADLARWLPLLANDNAQGEYYLTDIIALAAREGLTINTAAPRAVAEVLGVNDRSQQAQLERRYQRRQAEALMATGVTLIDPERFELRGELHCGHDVTIDVGCVFEGKVTLADGVQVGPYSILRDCAVGAETVIHSHSLIDGAEVATACSIGPFARLRPGTTLAAGAKVGNFVETKKAQIGPGSKINHLSYVGDAELGREVNIGAGTITCNYDGVNKHRTLIGDGAFIGSNSALVAPVTIGDHATVGAGSTVTRDVPENSLGVARGKQRNIADWARPKNAPQQ